MILKKSLLIISIIIFFAGLVFMPYGMMWGLSNYIVISPLVVTIILWILVLITPEEALNEQ